MWQKLGRIFYANEQNDWMVSHASNPIADWIGEDRCRIYFSTRDRQNRSRVAALTLDLRTLKVSDLSSRPLMEVGARGSFDDCGISVGSIVEHEGRKRLYYLGWNLGVTVPFRNTIGLATWDRTYFQRYSPAPVLGQSEADPLSLSYPWVLKDGSTWKMWYGSTLSWDAVGSGMTHILKYAESNDGVVWRPISETALSLRGKKIFSRPTVIKTDSTYRMWFSYREDKYRIGYAESQDGIHWEWLDEDVIPRSATGWDSESVAYPSVFENQGTTYLLYSGNEYGKSGFGMAVFENG